MLEKVQNNDRKSRMEKCERVTSKESKKNKEKFDKYFYYRESVQSPDNDVEFLRDTYKALRGKNPKVLGEDFCGTHAICCEWVKLNSKFEAIGVELDSEPLDYGREHYQGELTKTQRKSITTLQANVLDKDLPKVDVLSAMNFSYYIFKDRKTLLRYFKNAYSRMKKNGIFVVDSFGGPHCMESNEEETDHGKFSYFWDQDSYDPVTNYAQFYIHFREKGQKKREKVFSYDWRMWSIPEIRDLMAEAGFKETHVYWEGDDDDGEGNGEFTRVEEGEECDAWVAYIVGTK